VASLCEISSAFGVRAASLRGSVFGRIGAQWARRDTSRTATSEPVENLLRLTRAGEWRREALETSEGSTPPPAPETWRLASKCQELRLLSNAYDVPGGIAEDRKRFALALRRERRHHVTALLADHVQRQLHALDHHVDQEARLR